MAPCILPGQADSQQGIITQPADETGHEFRLYIFCDICGAKLMPFEHIIFLSWIPSYSVATSHPPPL